MAPTSPIPHLARFIVAGALITASVLAFQIWEKAGISDPTALPVFYRLFVVEDLPLAVLMLVVIAAVTLVPNARRFAARFAIYLGERPIAASAGTFMVLAFGSVFICRAYPLTMDEYVPWTQSQIFAAGHVLGQFDPTLFDWLIPPGFQNYFFFVDRHTGEFISNYWPGFAMLLTPFMALGVPWLCNPLMGAASLWTIHRITLQLSGSVEAAGTAMLFCLASPVFLINAMTYYSMPAHLLCNALFALLLLRPRLVRAFGAGLIGGLALNLHNPSRHAVFAIPWLFWLAWTRRWRCLLAAALGYVPGLLLGVGWHRICESVVASTSSGEAVKRQLNPMAEAYRILAHHLQLPGPVQFEDWAISMAKAWLWSVPMLLLLASWGFQRHSKGTFVKLLYASLVVTILGKFLIPLNQGHGWGFRFLHGTWFVIPVLAALVAVPSRGTDSEQDSRGQWRQILEWSRGAAIASIAVLLPYCAWQVHSFVGRHLGQLPETRKGDARLLLINPAGYYAVDLVQNDAFMQAPVLRMLSQGDAADQEMVAKHFPHLQLLSQDERGSVWGIPEGGSP